MLSAFKTSSLDFERLRSVQLLHSLGLHSPAAAAASWLRLAKVRVPVTGIAGTTLRKQAGFTKEGISCCDQMCGSQVPLPVAMLLWLHLKKRQGPTEGHKSVWPALGFIINISPPPIEFLFQLRWNWADVIKGRCSPVAWIDPVPAQTGPVTSGSHLDCLHATDGGKPLKCMNIKWTLFFFFYGCSVIRGSD